jgi:hypothetical protein
VPRITESGVMASGSSVTGTVRADRHRASGSRLRRGREDTKIQIQIQIKIKIMIMIMIMIKIKIRTKSGTRITTMTMTRTMTRTSQTYIVFTLAGGDPSWNRRGRYCGR